MSVARKPGHSGDNGYVSWGMPSPFKVPLMAVAKLVCAAIAALAVAACTSPPPAAPAAPASAPLPPVRPAPPPPPPPPQRAPAPAPAPVESASDRLQRLNTEYLGLLRQGKEAEAQALFSRLLAASLEARQINLRLLFAVGSAEFWPDPVLRRRYAGWLAELGRQLQDSPKLCVQVVGVASASGSASTNQRVAQQRAQRVRQILVGQAPEIAPRLSLATELVPPAKPSPRDAGRVAASGAGTPGSADGGGLGAAAEAGDRRAEFRVLECSARP